MHSPIFRRGHKLSTIFTIYGFGWFNLTISFSNLNNILNTFFRLDNNNVQSLGCFINFQMSSDGFPHIDDDGIGPLTPEFIARISSGFGRPYLRNTPGEEIQKDSKKIFKRC